MQGGYLLLLFRILIFHLILILSFSVVIHIRVPFIQHNVHPDVFTSKYVRPKVLHGVTYYLIYILKDHLVIWVKGKNLDILGKNEQTIVKNKQVSEEQKHFDLTQKWCNNSIDKKLQKQNIT